VTPYYDEDGIVIYHGDCAEILPSVSADGILTDPPYGLGMQTRADGGGVCSAASGNLTYERSDWDRVPAPKAVIDALLARQRPTVIWGGNYFNLPPSRCWLVWDKGQRDFSLADAELAWSNIDAAVRVFNYGRWQVVAEGKFHPTQKPEPLMAWCLERMKLPRNGVVLDPFMGSGTTLVAAKRVGRRAIGIEREERYCEIAAKRLAQRALPLEIGA
jgi:site-specific DNA-methyltransferase (adenine-specific)